jgi:hypothetical protein
MKDDASTFDVIEANWLSSERLSTISSHPSEISLLHANHMRNLLR